MKYSLSILLLVSLVLFSGCDLPHQPGPMPTEIVETEFEPGLNILGVLRADDKAGASYISVNRALTTEEIYSDSIDNFSPDLDFVKVSPIDSSEEYLFSEAQDSTAQGTYRDSTLTVLAGETYELEIRAAGFPTLTGETIIPMKPLLMDNTLLMEPGKLSFTFRNDASAFEYKLYIIFSKTALEKVIQPGDQTTIDVVWVFDSEKGLPQYLMLSALDENLTRYGNSPISFIPNTYHQDGSTVSGGYGCFGSVAITMIEL